MTLLNRSHERRCDRCGQPLHMPSSRDNGFLSAMVGGAALVLALALKEFWGLEDAVAWLPTLVVSASAAWVAGRKRRPKCPRCDDPGI